MKIKIATFTDVGHCKRQDVNDFISSLVRMGYEVYLEDKDYICFKLGADDILEGEKDE